MSVYGKRKEHIILTLSTFCVLFIIFCTAGIVRSDADTRKTTEPVNAWYVAGLDNPGYDLSDKMILQILYEGKDYTSDRSDPQNNPYLILVDNFEKYLGKPEDFNTEQTDKLMDKVNELIGIIKLEKECDFTRMSIDGRTVAIGISKQICGLLGLTLDIDLDGTIEYISKEDGRDIYWKDKQLQPADFNVYAFLITISVITAMIGMMFYISKKNQLFIRNVGQNEFDEKRFA